MMFIMAREFGWIWNGGQAAETLDNTAFRVFKYSFSVLILVAWVLTALSPGSFIIL